MSDRTPTLEREEQMLRQLRSEGFRVTPQREAIVRVFATDASHPTAQELFERLRPDFPSMSFATVYNTLDALARARLSRTLHLGGAARFDPNVEPHHHAVCDACGSIADIPVATTCATKDIRDNLARVAKGFSVRAVLHTYRGTCADCTDATS